MMTDIATLNKNIGPARDFWRLMLPTPAPEVRQFVIWLNDHTLDTLCYAIGQASKKCAHLNNAMTELHARRFVSTVCRRVTAEKQKKVA